MNPATRIDRSRSDLGQALHAFADSDSRTGFDRPAVFDTPRPVERAPGTNFLALQFAFDSFRKPVPAGQRGQQNAARHLVYMSRDYAVDVRLEASEHQSAVLRGELLSRGHGPVAEVPAFLLDGCEIAGYSRTGSLGEFQLETDGATDLRICLLLDAERCIDLPIDTDPATTARPASQDD